MITALVVEGQTAAQVARRYEVSRGWVYKLKARYDAEGEVAFEPRSRRPVSSPTATSVAMVDLVLRLRKELAEAGLDAGADTIGWHLAHHHDTTLSRATINRILNRAGAVTPEPAKRPRSSYIRFQADQPNECWQSDFTHYRLTRPNGKIGIDTEILTWLDDHSRFALRVSAHLKITGRIVVASFRQAADLHGYPASTLTDNGMVYTVRLASAGVAGGRTGFEAELRRLGIVQKNSRPNHPTTCGKVERFQQTLKKWLAAQPVQPASTYALQTLIDQFVETYNQHRPHRSLPGRCTPAVAYQARPKARPNTDRSADSHDRVRRDHVDANGKLTLRVNGRLHHIGIGRTHARTPVLLLVHDLHARIIHATTGEIIRELTIDPTRDYQPTGRPRGPAPKTQTAEPPR
nr:DDE-type integrase/transposase/recombinase [Pseudofrankia inefficax]